MKLFRISIFILLIALSELFAEGRFVLVLSGGGARGLAHIGVIRRLEELNLVPDMIIGTSMGAIVGSLYSAGYSSEDIEQLVQDMDIGKMFHRTTDRQFVSLQAKSLQPLFTIGFDSSFTPILPMGLISGQVIYSTLSGSLLEAQLASGGDFDRLPIPLRVVTTDLNTGETLIHDSGDLVQLVKAASSVPGIFSPVNVDGRCLADGGLNANLPVMSEIVTESDFVLAVDATSPVLADAALSNPLDIVLHVIGLGMEKSVMHRKNLADVVIQPDLGLLKNNEFDSTQIIIEKGYLAALEFPLDSLISCTAKEIDLPREEIVVPYISIAGNKKTNTKYLERFLGFSFGDTVTTTDITQTVKRIYGTGLFEDVHITADNDTIIAVVTEAPNLRLDVGVRFDEYYLGEVMVSPRYQNIFGYGISAGALFQIGYLRKKILVNFLTDIPVNPQNSIKSDFAVYVSSERIISREVDDTTTEGESRINYREADISKNGINLSLGWELSNIASIFGGYRFERYAVSRSLGSTLSFDISENKNRLEVFFAGIDVDYKDADFFPSHGGVQQFWFSAASKDLGSSRNLFTINGFHQFVIPVGESHFITPSIRYSWADQPLPEAMKYYIGGGRRANGFNASDMFYSIPFSGVEERAIPADKLFLVELWYRYQFSQYPLSFSTYLTWGTAWDEQVGQNLPMAVEELFRDAPLSLETELALKTIFGPIRFSWSRIVAGSFPKEFGIKRKNLFRFSVGYNF